MYSLSPLAPLLPPGTRLDELPPDAASPAGSSSSVSTEGAPAIATDGPDIAPLQPQAPADAPRAQRNNAQEYRGITPLKDADSVIAQFAAMKDNLLHARVSRGYQAVIGSEVKDSFLRRVQLASALAHGPERTQELARLSGGLGLPGVQTPDRTEALTRAVNERDADGRTALHEVGERLWPSFEGDPESWAAQRQTAEHARAAEITLLLKTGAGDDGALAAVAMGEAVTPAHFDEILRNPNAGPWAFAAVVRSPAANARHFTDILRRDNVGEGVLAAIAGSPQAMPEHLTDIVGRENISEGVLVAVARSPLATKENLGTALRHGAMGNWARAAVARAANVTVEELEEIVRHPDVGDEALAAVAASKAVTPAHLDEILRNPNAGPWAFVAVVRSPAANARHLTDIVGRENIGEGVLEAAARSPLATTENLRTILHHSDARNWTRAAVARAGNVTMEELQEIVQHPDVDDSARFAVTQSPAADTIFAAEVAMGISPDFWATQVAMNAMFA